MSVNLDKNRNSIVTAWKDVLDDNSETNWVLYGYEGQTNDLKLVSKGVGGLDELAEDLNSGKIMYAFARVLDPKTSLTKFLLINWQGEGAPTVRKGTCANHIRDISKLLTGAQLTINARTEDDVESERIMEKIIAVGSAYSFKEPRLVQEETRGPVGTNYSRIIPAKEINSKDRDSFWKKEEEEEKQRVQMELQRKQTESKKAEDERRAREEQEHNAREIRLSLELKSPVRSPVIEKTFNYEKSDPPSPNLIRSTTQAEEMRQQRNREAKELIGSRVGTAKAIFTQNSSSGQMQTSIKSSSSSAAPTKPKRNSIAQRINSLNNQAQETVETTSTNTGTKNTVAIAAVAASATATVATVNDTTTNLVNSQLNNLVIDSDISQHKENLETLHSNSNGSVSNTIMSQQNDNYDDDSDQFSTIKRSPYTKTGNSQEATTPVETNDVTKQNVIINSVANNSKDGVFTEADIIYQDVLSDGGLKAKALYDYQAADESEITFDPGDIITHIDQIDEGWWQGLGPDGSYGLFPANYVELI